LTTTLNPHLKEQVLLGESDAVLQITEHRLNIIANKHEMIIATTITKCAEMCGKD